MERGASRSLRGRAQRERLKCAPSMTAHEIAKERAKGVRYMVKRVIRAQELSLDARALWLLIESFADKHGQNAHPSMATLAELSGHKIKWVVRYLRELRDGDWISTHSKPVPGGRVNVYHLHLPEKRADQTLDIYPKKGQMGLPQKRVVRSTPKKGIDRVSSEGGAAIATKAQSEDRVLGGKRMKRQHLKAGAVTNHEADAVGERNGHHPSDDA